MTPREEQQLRADIAALKQQVLSLMRTDQKPPQRMRDVFVAKKNTAADTWDEEIAKNGSLVLLGNGRTCTGASSPSKVVELGDSEFVLLQIPDTQTGAYRYLKISSSSMRRVLITTGLTGGGFYSGKRYFGSTSISSSTTIGTGFGSLPASDDCVIANMAEYGQNTHNLTTDSTFPTTTLLGWEDGSKDTVTGRPIVWTMFPGWGC